MDELLKSLQELVEDPSGDTENDHMKADNLLLKFIDDAKITELFKAIKKWYARSGS